MVTIQIDEQTAEMLEGQARLAGLSLAEYVRTLVPSTAAKARPAWDELEREILALSTPAPTLPANLSRADLYGDHD